MSRLRLRIPCRPLPALLALLVALCAAASSAQRLVVAPDHPGGVYRTGETIGWQVRWEGTDPAPPSADYVVKMGGLAEIGRGRVALSGGSGRIDTRLDKPGTVLIEVRSSAATRERALAGAAVAPERIEPSASRPRDFDSFWAAKLKELQAVPADPRLEPVDAGKPGISYWKLTMANIRGSHIHGQLARPVKGAKLPALLIVQWAGVYGLQKAWAVDRAADGWLVLNIEAHDLPIDESESFYRDQSAGPLANYPAIGNDDRETSYFLRMYLSCYRAAQYLSERRDWDGRTLVVMGGSQGGMQALVTAAIHPKITAAMAEVPAGCDLLGPEVGRAPGWPMWYWQTQGRDPAKVRQAARYYDVVNFASRIRCPVLIGAGLIDDTCPPAGILAAANRMRASREVILLPRAGHQDENGSHGAYGRRCWSEWLASLRQGRPAPIRPGIVGAAN